MKIPNNSFQAVFIEVISKKNSCIFHYASCQNQMQIYSQKDSLKLRISCYFIY